MNNIGVLIEIVKRLLRFASGGHAFSRDPRKLRKRLYLYWDQRNQKIKTYKKALVKLIVQQQKQINRIHESTDEVNRLEESKYRIAVDTKKYIEQLQAEGMDIVGVRKDALYTRKLNTFQQLHGRATKLHAEIETMEEQTLALAPSIQEHTSRILRLLEEQREMRHEMDQALFELMTARATIAASDEMLKHSEQPVPPELERLRSLRIAARAEARVRRDTMSSPETEPAFDWLVGLQ
jgi:predicted  nucleic acid-binding Zn-ribbon protein